MRVLKFGGSSLADAEGFIQAAFIVTTKLERSDIAVVVSAPQGVTASLLNIVQLQDNDQQLAMICALEKKVIDISQKLQEKYTKFDFNQVKYKLENIMHMLHNWVKGAALLDYLPDVTKAQVLSCGEWMSEAILDYTLQSLGCAVMRLDPRRFIKTDDHFFDATVDLSSTKTHFARVYTSLAPVMLMPGFIGSTAQGKVTLLGFNGSDYSAAVLAICIKAQCCEIWTDVNGIYNADPRYVSNAKLVPHFSYEEAMELSYFGAQVLHPKTIAPIAQYQIPCEIKKTTHPEAPGTLISSTKHVRHSSDVSPVKAISSLKQVTMLTISGSGLKGKIGVASRIFSAISSAGISLIIISQSSSEYSISFCIKSNEAGKAIAVLRDALRIEMEAGYIAPLMATHHLAVISLIGDRMQHKKGIAAKFFESLAQAHVNVVAIAQDASERSISAVILEERCQHALNVCHQNIFFSQQCIDVFIVGCGTVGSALLDQISLQQKQLKKKNIALNVYGIANRQGMRLSKTGIHIAHWRDWMKCHAGVALSVDVLHRFSLENCIINPVFVDCTSSQEIAEYYCDLIHSGFHVVTPNKKANTANYSMYWAIREAAQYTQCKFLYETTVGAGLPIINMLQGLLHAGDELISFEGILSGSLSYIFGQLEEGVPLSVATRHARERGYTEPDPREDLSGMDVARKVLIIARETGLSLALENIHVEAFLPEKLQQVLSSEDFMKKLPEFDATFSQRVQKAQQKNCVLRYVGRISEGICRVGITQCDVNHPLYAIKEGENAIAICTRYYQPLPLVLRGYGAGATVTAAGVFGDLLRTLARRKHYWENVH